MKQGLRQHPAGITVTELLFVAGLTMVLSMLIFTGANAMMRSSRVSNSTAKLVSTLNLARNLAITHNAVYHVRLQNYSKYAVETAPGTWAYMESQDQALGIYCYPKVDDALKVTSVVRKPTPTTPEPIGQPRLVGAQVLGPSASDWAWGGYKIIGTSKNYRVDYVKMEPQVYIGLQYPDSTTAVPTDDSLLYFLPDGTASNSLTFFITNDAVLRDNPLATDADWLDVNRARILIHNAKDLSTAVPTALQAKLYSKPTITMVQVYRGGMIRTLFGEQAK